MATTPPAGFDPQTATPAELQQYDFPAEPSGGPALQNWQQAMSAFTSDAAPTGALQVDLNPGRNRDLTRSGNMSTYASNWAGFFAGDANSQSHFFVAVQADITVPQAAGCATDPEPLGAWIGLGGTDPSNPHQLVQQGEECGDTAVSSGRGFRPFQEFANTNAPVAMCGYSGWMFGQGDLLFQEMSYETSSDMANFYIEDETTGVAHGCTVSAPLARGWSFDGNTGDYEVETPNGVTVPFSTIHFTNALVEIGSSGSWVGFGTRPTTKTYDGLTTSDYCAGPSTIGADNESFTVSYSAGDCGV